VNVTTRPEEAVALTVTGDWAIVLLARPPNAIVWLSFLTTVRVAQAVPALVFPTLSVARTQTLWAPAETGAVIMPVSPSLAPPKAPSVALIAVQAPPSRLTSADATAVPSVAVAVTLTAAPENEGLGERTGVVTVGGVVSPTATVSSVVPLTSPSVALIVLVPGLAPRASPVVAPIVATTGLLDAQVTEEVRSAVVASE
jgi:hypothetical protein